MRKDIQICCLCGEIFMGYGNNPWPLESKVRGFDRCCDKCNYERVIPARLLKLEEKK